MPILHATDVDRLEVPVGFARREAVDEFLVDALGFALNVVVGRKVEQSLLLALAVNVDAFNQAVSGVLAALGLGTGFGLSDIHACGLYRRRARNWGGFYTLWHWNGRMKFQSA